MADEGALLSAGAQQLGVPLEVGMAQQLLRLLDELTRWNRAYNLTAITDREQMLTHHLLDSLPDTDNRHFRRFDTNDLCRRNRNTFP